jgi:hypothetical protein
VARQAEQAILNANLNTESKVNTAMVRTKVRTETGLNDAKLNDGLNG